MTPNGLARLCLDEGLRLTAYPDPLTGADPWTIGFGCTGAPIAEGTVWTLPEALAQRDARIATIEANLPNRLAIAGHGPGRDGPGLWEALDPNRRDVMVNMAYQLGISGLMLWPKFLNAMDFHLWRTAALELELSAAWNEGGGELRERFTRHQGVIVNGVYPDPQPATQVPGEWLT